MNDGQDATSIFARLPEDLQWLALQYLEQHHRDRLVAAGVVHEPDATGGFDAAEGAEELRSDWSRWLDRWEQLPELDQRNEWDDLERYNPVGTQYLMSEFNDRMRRVMENWLA